MQRRDFLKKAGVGAVAASAVFGPVYAQALPRLRWRMATGYPRALDVAFGGVETLARRVGEMTGGRFQITAHPAGELVPTLKVLDAVSRGSVEMGHGFSPWWVGHSPSLAFEGQPFGLDARQQNAWLYHGGGLEAMRKVFADFNLINFPSGNLGVQMGGWFRREIRGLEDVRGLRMRIAGLGAKVWARLGVTALVIPTGEIFLALERGAVDAAEFVAAHDDERLGLHRAARYYYYPGWQEPGATLSLYIHLARWRELPKEYQEAVGAAAAETNVTMLADYDAKNGPAMDRLIRGRTQPRPFPRSILLAAERASEELYEEIAGRDATYREILTSWRRFREVVRRGNRFTEGSYAAFINSAR